MNIWEHSMISARKFGGIEQDYYQIHKFIDSSKLFYFHFKHRLILHNLFGVELAIKKFEDYIVNDDNSVILVRDIAIEHLKEDCNGQVPSLTDWLSNNDKYISKKIRVPTINNSKLEKFVFAPLMKSNLKSSLLITLSDFGVCLANDFLGFEEAKELNSLLSKESTIKNFLKDFKFTEKWQFSPDKNELDWLKTKKNEWVKS